MTGRWRRGYTVPLFTHHPASAPAPGETWDFGIHWDGPWLRGMVSRGPKWTQTSPVEIIRAARKPLRPSAVTTGEPTLMSSIVICHLLSGESWATGVVYTVTNGM